MKMKMHLMRKVFSVLLFIWLISIPAKLSAQIVPVSEPEGPDDNIFWSLVPFGAYTSDSGFFGSVLFKRINYGDDISPYHSSLRVDFSASTRRKLESGFVYERTNLFGTSMRHRTLVHYMREPNGPYYGIGNTSVFTNTDFEQGAYFYELNQIMVDFMGRKKLFKISDHGILEGVFRLRVSNRSLYGRGANTVFEQDNPFGSDGGWVNKLGAGLIIERRNSEFAPSSGFRYETGANLSESFLGSDYSFNKLFADFRHYYSPFNNVVLAHKAEVRHSSGDVPFWQLPILGNEKGLRGYSLDRFIGDSSVLQILELRTWLFSILDDNIKIGSHLFWDSGRVFSEFDSNGVFEDWNHTFGIGGTISAFSPDLIIRGEAAFSDENFRIYAGLGYLF